MPGCRPRNMLRECLGPHSNGAQHISYNGGVAGDPRLANLLRKVVAEPLLQRCNQRSSHRVVVRRLNPVRDMPSAKRLNRRGDLFPLPKIGHSRAEHAHQLLALLSQIVLEQSAQPRIALEEILIEQGRRHIGYRRDFGKAGLHENLLFGRHDNLRG